MRSRLAGTLLLLCCALPVSALHQAPPSPVVNDTLTLVREAYVAGQLSTAQELAASLLTQTDIVVSPIQAAMIKTELGKIATMQSHYLRANTLFSEAEAVFVQYDKPLMQAGVLADKGRNFFLQSQYADAFNLYTQAKDLFANHDEKHGEALQQLNIGILLHAEGVMEPSLQALEEALTVLRQFNDTDKIARALSEIGSVYVDMAKYQEAAPYLRDALVINQELGLTYELARTHSLLGELYLQTENFDAAQTNLLAAFSSFNGMNTPLDIETTQASLGRVAVAKGEVETGLKFLRTALERARRNGFSSLVTEIHLSLSDVFLKLKDSERALSHAQWAFLQAKEHGELNAQILAQDKVINAYIYQQDFRHAFEALQIRTTLQSEQLSSNQSINLAKVNAELEVQRQAQAFELQEKNRSMELANVRQQNLQNMLALGALVSLLLFVFLLWSRYNQYLQNKRLAREVKNRTNELEVKNHQLEEAMHALEQLSMRDPLTGLYNRNYLNAQLPGEIQRVQHFYDDIAPATTYPPNHDLLCFLIDIDFFKRINDEHGHLAGDRFLIQFTDILKEVFRQTDLLIRWGGEEFLVVCRNADRTDAVELADRLLFAVKSHTFKLPGNVPMKATCSIGFCALPLCRRQPYELDWLKTFAVMDYCLYAAKLSQRDCWVGAEEACMDSTKDITPNKLEEKFDLKDTSIKTSLTNLASIEWPAD